MKINCAKVTVKKGTPREPGRVFHFRCEGGDCGYWLPANSGHVTGCRFVDGNRCGCKELQRDWLKENAR